MSLVVADTTPLHYLILIECEQVLPQLFGQLLVPSAVIKEMQHPKAPALVKAWANNLPAWVKARSPERLVHVKLGPGENEAISLAVEIADVALLVDDKKARVAASSYGLLTVGTLTIMDLADEAGLLDFETALERLLKTNFHIEGKLLEEVRQSVRERRDR